MAGRASEDTMQRGTFQFSVTAAGDLVNSAQNVEALRRLWLDRTLIKGHHLGPGDPGDFDNGAWHVACHLVAAGGVMRTKDGNLLWVEISHNSADDTYFAGVTIRMNTGSAKTLRLDSSDGLALVSSATLVGFVEGNSTGHTSARGVSDPPTLFNLWRRQDFDQPVDSRQDGGKVWEHWCTLRDIRPAARIATSVLTAYVGLVAALGDRFAPTVARGRRDYAHPEQLKALVTAGFTVRESALWDTVPVVIPPSAETLFSDADPAKALQAVQQLDWSNPPRYYMFARRIGSWSHAPKVRQDLSDIR